MRKTLIAIVEPPTEEDANWVVEAPAIHYQAQGRTRREAIRRFEETMDEALEWAVEHGARLTAAQPELLEFEVA